MKDDTISRQEAINVFGDVHPLDYNAQTYLDKIKALPSAQPEKGTWIEVGREQGALGIEYKTLRCSKCSWESSLPIPRNFCPECGCDMRKE